MGTTHFARGEISIQRFRWKKWHSQLRHKGLDGTIMLQMNLK